MNSQADLAVTRRSLHGVAELLLAGPQYQATGTLRLAVLPGGFATTRDPRLLVDGVRVSGAAGVSAGLDGRTPRELGAELGVTAGPPAGGYGDGSGVGPDDPLTVDPEQAAVIMAALASGQLALAAFAPDQVAVLWPEHFDLAIRVEDTNYGVSPGDGFLGEPYAYIGVASAPSGDAFWNAPFGAAVPLRGRPDGPAIASFFADGRARLGGHPR